MSRMLFVAQLDDIAHEQTIMCRQLFAGQVVEFRSYHSITKFVFKEYLREAKRYAIFHARAIARRSKA